MLIKPGDAPQQAFNAILHAVTTAEEEITIRKPGQAPLTSRTLHLSVPHRIAYLALGNIRDGGNLREATVTGNWCYLVLEERRAPAPAGHDAGTVTYTPIAIAMAVADGDGYRFGSWQEGPLAAGTEAAIRAAEALPDRDDRSYEPFLLLAPSVHLTALWLKDLGSSDGDASDWIVPIPPSNLKLTPHKAIRSQELFAGLLDSAARVRSHPQTV